MIAEQLSLFEDDGIKGCCRADMMFKRLYENVIDCSFYCSECGGFISHPAPKMSKRETCPKCGRLITAVRSAEYYKARGEGMPEKKGE